MVALGYFASLFIGISLGMIGGGGSILTMPVLVYLFGISPVLATSYSLFIVGSTSGVGAIRNIINKNANIRTAVVFGGISVIVVFLVRKLIVHSIPEKLTTIGGSPITYSLLTMIIFAALMIIAAKKMIRNKTIGLTDANDTVSVTKLFATGILIGLITGFLGVGGGFLIIPALVLIIRLSMKHAVGTSLIIITLNTVAGFIGDIGKVNLDWQLLLSVTAIAIIGVFIGGYLNDRLSSGMLKKIFGWFILCTGIYILIKEGLNVFYSAQKN